MRPTISLIITVFNKAEYLPDTVRSLFWQQAGLPAGVSVEYIFVDDVSSDNSLNVIEELAREMDNVAVIRNAANAGPSVRLNQGARLARGDFLQFFDSDDIMPAGTTATLYRLLTEQDADLAYGRWRKTDETGPQMTARKVRVDAGAKFRVSDAPLETVLLDSFSRMTFMVKAEVFARAQGADERIFVQDESLPIRLASGARRLIVLEEPVLLVPIQDETLSSNKSQLNHDRFLANAFMLRDRPELSPHEKQLLFRRCVSAAWKQSQRDSGPRAFFSWVFRWYLYTRLRPVAPDIQVLAQMEDMMARLPDVRRARLRQAAA